MRHLLELQEGCEARRLASLATGGVARLRCWSGSTRLQSCRRGFCDGFFETLLCLFNALCGV